MHIISALWILGRFSVGLCNILPSAFGNLQDLLNYSLRNVQGLSIAVTSFLLVNLDTGFELSYLSFIP